MSNSDWAAWVQAVGGILAVGGAAWLPVWHERRSLQARQGQLIVTIKALARSTFDMAGHVAAVMPSEAHRRGEAMFGNSAEYQPLVGALAAFPAHELTDSRTLETLFDLRRIAARGDRYWRAIVEHGDENELSDWQDLVDASRSLEYDAGIALAELEA